MKKLIGLLALVGVASVGMSLPKNPCEALVSSTVKFQELSIETTDENLHLGPATCIMKKLGRFGRSTLVTLPLHKVHVVSKKQIDDMVFAWSIETRSYDCARGLAQCVVD